MTGRWHPHCRAGRESRQGTAQDGKSPASGTIITSCEVGGTGSTRSLGSLHREFSLCPSASGKSARTCSPQSACRICSLQIDHQHQFTAHTTISIPNTHCILFDGWRKLKPREAQPWTGKQKAYYLVLISVALSIDCVTRGNLVFWVLTFANCQVVAKNC